ncbi:MAG: CinA family protein [Chromatiales bacterium]|nr:CinA family protein [Chromatiales bacterium]
MFSDADIADLVTELAECLLRGGRTLATAESCTGGWISKALTDLPGSSEWFGFGLVTYSDEAKQRLLGVQPGTLERHGAVSEQVVEEMARGLLKQSDADLGLAVSGVAGPGGGSVDKPVGTVWFAWSWREADAIQVQTGLQKFPGDRESVRRQAVMFALQGVLPRA